MKEIKGKSVIIVGFGREGKSSLRFLNKFCPELEVTVADKDPGNVNNLSCLNFSGNDYLSKIRNYDTVIRSPGISRQVLEAAGAKYITTATNIFFSEYPGKIVGITGTKGKSTTSSLIYQILKTAGKDARFGGNIGKPVLDFLHGANKNTFFVTELSSYQLDDLKFSPYIAIILPITQEHLNYHGSFKAYVEAKSHIVSKQKKSDYIIFYGENYNSKKIAQKSQAFKIQYPGKNSLHNSVWFDNGYLWIKTEDQQIHSLMSMEDIPLLGRANAENVSAAVTVGLTLGIDRDTIKKAIKGFKPLEHRLEHVGVFSGISFYNDSLATTPEATIRALEALDNKVTTLIAGGYDRGLDFTQLGVAIAHSAIKNLLLFPMTGSKIMNAVNRANPQREILIMEISSMEEAIKSAYKFSSQGTICLMSPSAASFNLFKDYADRGNQFKYFVRKLSTK